MTYDKKCDQCRVRDAVLVDEGGLPKCYECEVRLQGAAIHLLRDMLATAQTQRDEARVALDGATRSLADATDDLGAAQDEVDALRADLKRYTDVYGDPDAPADTAYMGGYEPIPERSLAGSLPWGRDKVDALLRDHAPPFAPSTGLVWSVEGTAGERILRATWGAYSARIVEGRVWRWQVGTDASPDLYGGRIVGTLEDTQTACFHALSLCLLGEKSDVPHGTSVNRHPIADAPRINVGDHVRCESLGNLTGIVETVNPSEVPGWDQCLVRDDREGHVWVAAAWILEVLP